jgi:hypothetical protein
VPHEIKMTAPGVVLGKQDVIFEVVVDGAKRGELHISQGDLRWWPRNSKRDVRRATWAELANWMESE